MTAEKLKQLHDALALLDSMVNGGEQHSPTSINITQTAFAILRNTLPPSEGATHLWTAKEYMKGCEHDGSFIPVNEVIRLMNGFAAAQRQQPTAEEAEEFLKNRGWDDIENDMIPASIVVKQLQEFTAQQQPTAEGAEDEELIRKIFSLNGFDFDAFELDNEYSAKGLITSMRDYIALHAQRIADKMVSERLRKELSKFVDFINDEYCDGNIGNMLDIEDVVKYLKRK